MTVEELMIARLGTVAALTTLIAARLYLDKVPQGTRRPAVVVQLIDDPTMYHQRGVVNHSAARIQIDAQVSEDETPAAYDVAVAMADAIHGDSNGPSATGLSGWMGTLGGLRVKGCHRLVRRRRYDPQELRVVTMTQEYRVEYSNVV